MTFPLGAGPLRNLGCGAGVGHLEVTQPRRVVDQQAATAEGVEALGGFRVGEAVGDHHVADHVGDPESGCARSVDDDALITHPRACGARGRERRGQHHRSGALHVVVEGAHLVRVAVEDAPRVAGPEVFPVQHGVWEQLGRGRDVGVDQPVVAFVADPGVPHAEVHVVVEQTEVVGAHVQDHRDNAVGVDARGGGVDGQLADGDLDAAHALVADAQDALGVGGDQ